MPPPVEELNKTTRLRFDLFLAFLSSLGTLQVRVLDDSLPYDLVIVGAGPHGLIAAHTWLEICPDSRVAILESEEEVG